jgi:hypothetical protein
MALGVSQLLLNDLGFNLEVREFVSQTLIVNPQVFALLFPTPDLLFQQHSTLDSDVIFGFQVLQGRGSVPGLSLVIVVGDFNITQLQL